MYHSFDCVMCLCFFVCCVNMYVDVSGCAFSCFPPASHHISFVSFFAKRQSMSTIHNKVIVLVSKVYFRNVISDQ